jgi:class I fructose-bisphosphate aldolase
MMEEIRTISEEAKAAGLVVVIWSYPRGGDLTKEGETAVDVCAYAAHMAAQLGAHIVKVKPPTAAFYLDAARNVYDKQKIDVSSLSSRIAHVMQATFNGRRIVVFSGGEASEDSGLFDQVRAIRDGGGHGSIMGRNSFQRPYKEACQFLDNVIRIYAE